MIWCGVKNSRVRWIVGLSAVAVSLPIWLIIVRLLPPSPVHLVAVATSDPNAARRAEAIGSIRKHTDFDRCVMLLARVLEDGDESRSTYAYLALTALKPKNTQCTEFLQKLATSPNPTQALFACMVLANFDEANSDIVHRLEAFIEDQSLDVQFRLTPIRVYFNLGGKSLLRHASLIPCVTRVACNSKETVYIRGRALKYLSQFENMSQVQLRQLKSAILDPEHEEASLREMCIEVLLTQEPSNANNDSITQVFGRRDLITGTVIMTFQYRTQLGRAVIPQLKDLGLYGTLEQRRAVAYVLRFLLREDEEAWVEWGGMLDDGDVQTKLNYLLGIQTNRPPLSKGLLALLVSHLGACSDDVRVSIQGILNRGQ